MTGRRIYLKGADSTDCVVTGQLDDGGIELDRDPDDLFDSGHMSHVGEWSSDSCPSVGSTGDDRT